MKKHITYITLIIGLIGIFLLLDSALAEDRWLDLNYSKRQIITNVPTEFPTPILIKAPNDCAFPDCRDYVIYDRGKETPRIYIDLDKDGIPEYIFAIVNLNLDILNQPSKIEYSNLTPWVKYENQTLINKLDMCYQQEGNIICKRPVLVLPVDIRDRFDVYTIVNFTSSPTIKYFCPLVMDLDTWPEDIMFLIYKSPINGTEVELEPVFYKIQNLDIYNGAAIFDINNASIFNSGQNANNEWVATAKHEIYSGALILIGYNKSIFITKPSAGRFSPSPNYFFKTETLSDGHIQASVCTSNHFDELLPPKGPNAYIVFGEPDYEKLVRMAISLQYIPDPIIHATESIETKFFKGNIWPLYYSSPEIVPKIVFKGEETFFPTLTFTWMMQEGETNQTLQSENGTLIFEQPILLNGSSWMYPIDTYKAVVYVNPPVIRDTNISLSFYSGEPYKGNAQFENNKILFRIERNADSLFSYIGGLIVSIIFFYLSNKHIKNLNKDSFQPGKRLEKLSLIGGFLLPYFFSVKIISSIGTVPYVLMISWLIISFYSRWKKITK